MTTLGTNDVRLFPVPSLCSPNPADVVLRNPRASCETPFFDAVYPDRFARLENITPGRLGFEPLPYPEPPPPPPPSPQRPPLILPRDPVVNGGIGGVSLGGGSGRVRYRLQYYTPSSSVGGVSEREAKAPMSRAFVVPAAPRVVVASEPRILVAPPEASRRLTAPASSRTLVAPPSPRTLTARRRKP